MKILVCGAGKITRELLKRLGDAWEIAVVEKSEELLTQTAALYPQLKHQYLGDASSPVVLEDAGVEGVDYLLALTNDDKVNLAACRFAREKGVCHILARVHEPEMEPRFREINVKTVMVNTMVSRTIYHYLQDPRLIVTPMGLGRGEVVEIDVSNQPSLIGRRVLSLGGVEWRLAAMIRQGELLFPDTLTTVEKDDQLIIIGRFEGFEAVCGLLEQCALNFPMAYGRGMLVALPPKKDIDENNIMTECFYLAQNTSIRQMTVLSSESGGNIQDRFSKASQVMDIQFELAGEKFIGRIKELCASKSIGLVVIPPFESSFLKTMAKTEIMDLAHALSCPLMIARSSQPYDRILVPFNATKGAEQAMDAAVNLARQMQGHVTAVIVREPEFMQGAPHEGWVDDIRKKVNEMAHIHKIKIDQEIRRGNPVKEITELARDFDLVVMGSMSKESSLFSPDVGELIARKAPCSVMIIAV